MLLEMAGIYFDLEAGLPCPSRICLRSRPRQAGLAGFPLSPLRGAARTGSGGWRRTHTPAWDALPCSSSYGRGRLRRLLVTCPSESILTLALWGPPG